MTRDENRIKLSKTSIPYLVFVALVTMFASITQAQTVDDWEEHGTPLVGQVAHLEGTLSRYDAESDEWVATVRHAPVGVGDRLYSDYDAKAELILPNNTWIRMDGDSEIELTALETTRTKVDIPLGTARMYNKSSTAQIKTTTPFGTIITPAGAVADLYVYSDGVDIIAMHNQVYFIHNKSGRRHEVTERGAALFADTRQVSTSHADVATDWGEWNNQMDALWAKRTRTRGDSATYLPPELQYDAYNLDTHGRWERVYYQGAYYRFWRPVHVHVGWTPFSSGYWHVWWGDHVWIPHEPFGYVTHHYGNWIFTAGHWYWAPPVTRVMVHAGLPLFRIGFAWYPGRVGWIHSSVHVGWFPLAPYEPYYCHRHWGRRAYVVTKYRHHHRYNYRHRGRAVVIHKAHLYRGKNYRDARIRKSSRIVANDRLRTTPVPNRSMAKDYRHRYGTKRFKQLPADRKGLKVHTRNRLHDRKPGVSTRDHKLKSRTPIKTRQGDQRLAMQQPRKNLHERKPGVSAHDRKLKSRTSKKTRPGDPRLAIQQTRKVERMRPAKPQNHRLTPKNAPKPVRTGMSTPPKRNRRPDVRRQPPQTQLKRAPTHKVTRQSRAASPMNLKRQEQPAQIRSFSPGKKGISPNRSIQHQGRQKSPNSYAPQWQNNRSSGYRSSGKRGYRTGR